MESWYTEYCPKCEAKNWFNNGDESDLSGVDIESIRCWNCQFVFLVGDVNIIPEELRDLKDIEDETYCEDGLEHPE